MLGPNPTVNLRCLEQQWPYAQHRATPGRRGTEVSPKGHTPSFTPYSIYIRLVEKGRDRFGDFTSDPQVYGTGKDLGCLSCPASYLFEPCS